MCGSIQEAARKKLRRILTDMGIPTHIIAMVLGEPVEWPNEDAPLKNLIRNSPLVVYLNDNGKPSAEIMRWGMLPQWKRDSGDTMPLINARSETVFTTRSFKSAARERRCVVFCEGFYEPRVDGSSAPFARYLFRSAQSELLAIAAIWSPSETDNAKEVCLLTTEPNGTVGLIHDRMPVLLDTDGIQRWCDQHSDNDVLTALLQPAPDDWLVATPVEKPRKTSRKG